MAERRKLTGTGLTAYRGFTLVNVGTNYYQACRGSERIPVGAIFHGDYAALQQRFIAAVDKALGPEENDKQQGESR